MADEIVVDRQDGVETIRLNRPERVNAISLGMVEGLHAEFDRLSVDPATRVLMITGEGRGFSAGTDLKEDASASWPESLGRVQTLYRVQQRVASLVLRLREVPQPVIAAVHGPAVGAGLSLLLASDVRIADPTAMFGAAFITIGLSAGDTGSSWFLPRVIGPARAAEMLYTGRQVGAQEAERIGLVSQVSVEGGHLAAARAVADQIMANSPLGIRMTKELLSQSLDAPALRQHLRIEDRTQILCSMTEDFAEGARSFSERRTPVYRDR